MIYLFNKTDKLLIGTFDNLVLAYNYINTEGNPNFEYIFLKEVETMSYTSKICFVDNKCIYNKRTFWINEAPNILSDYENHVVTDMYGNSIEKARFLLEYRNRS